MTNQEIANEFQNKSLEELRSINKVLVEFIKARQRVNNMTAAFSFTVGQKVKISSTVRPAKYAGLIATVKAVKHSKVLVKTDVFLGEINVPASLLIPA